MKTYNSLSALLLLLVATFLFSACGTVKTNDFQAQKYTNFKKGKTEVAVKRDNNVDKAVLTPIPAMMVSTVASEQPASNYLSAIEETPVPPVTERVVTTVKQKTKAVKQLLKRPELVSFAASRFLHKPNTASATPADAELVLLVILAIILPPLAVLLARGVGSEFLISILLTLLFWLPGQIYALLIVLDAI